MNNLSFITPPEPPPTPCNRELGLQLCKLLQATLADKHIYPALTGGLLYKKGYRKDIDIVLYRNRQKVEHFETSDLADELAIIGVEITEFFGFVTKAKWRGMTVDLFNPETKEIEGVYGEYC